MAKVLKQNVILRKDLNSAPEAFMVGDILPEWAEGLVGAHVYGEMPKYDGVAKPVTIKTGAAKRADAPAKQERAEIKVPSKSASKATWKKFAESVGITDYPADASRDEIIELVEAAYPELAE